MTSVDLTMPIATAKLILKLVRIAKKIHMYNPSPVHITEELAETNKDELEQLEQELDRLTS